MTGPWGLALLNCLGAVAFAAMLTLAVWFIAFLPAVPAQSAAAVAAGARRDGAAVPERGDVVVTTQSIEVGVGRLSWPASERRSGRYGTVMLMHDGDSVVDPSGYVTFDAFAGRPGTLVAEVLESRVSTHIGDVFRGLYPETPKVGERIVLGTGTVFIDTCVVPSDLIGLRPDDGRESDWLDPRALYRAHEQTVRLTLEPVTIQCGGSVMRWGAR